MSFPNRSPRTACYSYSKNISGISKRSPREWRPSPRTWYRPCRKAQPPNLSRMRVLPINPRRPSPPGNRRAAPSPASPPPIPLHRINSCNPSSQPLHTASNKAPCNTNHPTRRSVHQGRHSIDGRSPRSQALTKSPATPSVSAFSRNRTHCH